MDGLDGQMVNSSLNGWIDEVKQIDELLDDKRMDRWMDGCHGPSMNRWIDKLING